MAPARDHQLERLAVASSAGDEEARNKLMMRLDEVLRRFFIARVGPRNEVDDLVQNTLIRIHQSLSDVREPASLKSFAMKAALFELQDFYRGRYRPKEYVGSDGLGDAAVGNPDSAAAIDLTRALARLTPHARRIVELREYGFRYAEIAEMVGSTEAAIKMQVKRAFEKLKDLLVCLLMFASMLLIARL